MCEFDQQILGAFFDGELSADERRRVEAHLRKCPQCTEQLQMIRQASQVLAQHSWDDLKPAELRRVHEAIDREAERPILRIGGTLGLVAASVLIVSCAWLMELPAANSGGTQRQTTVAAAPAEPWEQVATTLRADPLQQQASDDTTQLADADAKLADWMLEGLSPKVNR